MSSLTIVTALFDIGRGSLAGQFQRGFDQYKEWFSSMLTIDLPMVIFCDRSLNDFILKIRNEDNTQICNRSIDHFRKMPHYDLVQNIRNKPEWYNQVYWLHDAPQAALELYNPLVMSKYYMLEYSVDLNPFDSEYFIWLDAGVTHTTDRSLFNPPFEERVIQHLDKLLFLAFPYRDEEVHGFRTAKLDEYAHGTVMWNVRAMLFGGPGYLIKQTTELYSSLLTQTLVDGYMGTEENILTLMTCRIPEQVNLRWIDGGFIERFLRIL